MNVVIPELSLVLIIGPSGSGKSTFAKKHFKPTEILSSDHFRAMLADDETDQTVTADAFETLHFVLEKRMQHRRFTVIDATNVQHESRQKLLSFAKKYHYLTTAIILKVPVRDCLDRNQKREDRVVPSHVIRAQNEQLQQTLRAISKEGFKQVVFLNNSEEIDSVVIERRPLWTDKRHEKPPFDIIGDLHGCYEELISLLTRLGYQDIETNCHHPEGRRLVFVGDITDRGPRSADTLRLVMSIVNTGNAFCVVGNHDFNLHQALCGRRKKFSHGLEGTMQELEKESEEFRTQAQKFLHRLVSHYQFDDGKLVVAHAGLNEFLIGRASGKVRSFAMYGDTTGETDEFGLPVRLNWAADYRGEPMVVYGHSPMLEAEWLNNTINIDTGCCFGGKLTALRYPERELVSVPALKQYADPVRPLESVTAHDGIDKETLDINDVLGKRRIDTRLQGTLTVREENSHAALEVMSRFAVDPRWLIYLPPTMSPAETSHEPGYLEHPKEALGYFRSQGVEQVMLQEKHMGSRTVVIVCRDVESAQSRFGTNEEIAGICYTRTGRRFFKDELEVELLSRFRTALDRVDFWNRFETTWACFDCELMPWSAKAQQLLSDQYAAVGSASRAATSEVVTTLEAAVQINSDVQSLLEQYQKHTNNAQAFTEAYRQYCWSMNSIADVRLAPFHLLATEGAAHVDKNHQWHIDQISEICQCEDPVFFATRWQLITLSDEKSDDTATEWWLEMTDKGGEGMVVKPLDYCVKRDSGKLVQPAVKCRGKEYLRIIYGPDYDLPENLERLRQRGLGHKRSLAAREFALGVEALERFVRKEPLRRVHECVFGVLALESEPVDPRL